jgi:hypothetical protein
MSYDQLSSQVTTLCEDMIAAGVLGAFEDDCLRPCVILRFEETDRPNIWAPTAVRLLDLSRHEDELDAEFPVETEEIAARFGAGDFLVLVGMDGSSRGGPRRAYPFWFHRTDR